MEKYYRQTVGLPVVSHAGEVLTAVRDVILDAEKGKIAGFWVTAGKNKVIAPIDILRWDDIMEIGDFHDIIDAHEVTAIEKALEKNLRIFRQKVFTKSGDYVGKVLDFGMNNQYFELTCLVVAKGFLGLIFWDKKIISARDILEVKKDGIIVKDLVTPVKMKKFQVDMAAP